MKHGAVNSNSDVVGTSVRVGSVSLTILELTKAITFSSALPDTNYKLFLQQDGNFGVSVWATNIATTGFTINVSAGVVGSVSYAAIAII